MTRSRRLREQLAVLPEAELAALQARVAPQQLEALQELAGAARRVVQRERAVPRGLLVRRAVTGARVTHRPVRLTMAA